MTHMDDVASKASEVSAHEYFKKIENSSSRDLAFWLEQLEEQRVWVLDQYPRLQHRVVFEQHDMMTKIQATKPTRKSRAERRCEDVDA